MNRFSKHIFLFKLIHVTAIVFAVIILSAQFFLVPEINDPDLIRRFYLSSGVAVGLLVIMMAYLIFSYVLTPEKVIRRQIGKVAKGDFGIDAELDDYGVFERAEHDLQRLKSSLRKRIEKLEFSRSYLEAVLLNMFDGVMVIDAEGKIMLVNEALKNVLVLRSKAIGKRPIEVMRNDKIQELAEKVLNEEGEVLKKEIEFLSPPDRVFLVHATPIIRKKKVEGAVLVFHDRTLQKDYEQMRKDFVANVSHELRTPISNIKGYIETLLEGAIADPEHAKDFLRTVEIESDRLVNLINDLLDLSRLESGRLALDIARSDLRAITGSVFEKFNKKTSQKNMSLSSEISQDARFLRADEDLIYQVIMNLVDNAVKYARPNGSVLIKSRRVNGFIQVDVTDNGPGIPESSRSRIFERFYRVDKARSRQMGGTGLGLSIVKHIVQEHGGKVWLSSSSGQGSTFSFTVPRFE